MTSPTLTWAEPDFPPLRGVLVVLPGRGESPSVYERLGRRLAVDSYRVHAVPAPSDDVEAALKETDRLLQESGDVPHVPRVVVGSDAGALYAAQAVASGLLTGADALVLAGLPVAGVLPPVGWDDELDLRTACPTHRGRITDAGVRPGGLFEPLPQEWLDPSVPGRLALPVLGLHGTADTVAPLDDAAAWLARAPRAELVGIRAGRHDVLNESTHRSVAASVVLFLERLKLDAALAPIALPIGLAA